MAETSPSTPPELRADSGTDKSANADADSLALSSTSEARSYLSREQCCNLNILPLVVLKTACGKELSAAVAKGFEFEAVQALRFKSELNVRPIFADRKCIQEAIFKAYSGDDQNLIRAAQVLKPTAVEPVRRAEQPRRKADSDTAAFLSALIDYAAARGASDLHFVPTIDGSSISLRINGIIRRRNERTFSKRQHEEIISRIKVLSNLNIAEKRLPQDGSFEINLTPNDVKSVRVGIMPTIYGERASLRFHGGVDLMNLWELGLSQRLEDELARALKMDSGLIIFSGPTGSGKTTSLYACLAELHRLGRSIITLEDPVEKVLPWASQTSLDKKSGVDYPAALSAALRHDPDTILLGEIRDRASAEIALQAALTGHMILTTVHARGAEEVVPRLRGLGIDDSDLSGALALTVYQRLLPKLCPKCKVFDLEASKLFQEEISKASACGACEMTGFRGRVLVAGAAVQEGAKKTGRPGQGLLFEKSLRTALSAGSISIEEYVSAGGALP